MPGSGFKRQALYVKSLIRQSLDTPFAKVQHALVCSHYFQHSLLTHSRFLQSEGTAAPSFTATLLEEASSEGKLTPEHEDDIKGAAGVIFAGLSSRPFTEPNKVTYLHPKPARTR